MTIILFLIFSALSFFPYALIYQQQFYNHKRFFLFLLGKIKKYILFFLLAIILLIVNYLWEKDYITPIFILIINLILFYQSFLKKRVIKLKFTKRIMRLFVGYLFLNSILTTSIYFFSKEDHLLIFLIALLLSPVGIVWSSLLNWPLQNKINKNYLNKAKTKISNHPNLLIIAITGSFGKTSTKYYLNHLINDTYKCLATPKSVNTLMGLSTVINNQLTYLDQVFIAELGVDCVGGMDKLLSLIKPNIALVTSIGQQHLATFKTVENIYKEKTKLYKQLTKNDIAVINRGDKIFANVVTNGKPLYFGSKDANIYPINISKENEVTNFDLVIEGKVEKGFSTKLLGDYALNNLIAAIAIALIIKVPIYKIKKNLLTLTAAPHRLEIKKESELTTIIDDSYNSNFNGFLAALNILDQFDKFKILITPGLIEQGDQNFQKNYQLTTQIANSCDYVYLVGAKNTKALAKGLKDNNYTQFSVVKNFKSAYQAALKQQLDKVILIENDLPDIYIK